MLDPPQYSPHLRVDRARAQVRDRNHFAFHRVREIRRGGESDELKVICLLSFTSLNERLPNRGAEASWELLAREIKLFVANLATRGHIGHTNKIGGLVLNERSTNETTNETQELSLMKTVPEPNTGNYFENNQELSPP
jgi:hypothetical protein